MQMCDFVPPDELVKGAYELLVHLSGGPTTNLTFQHVRQHDSLRITLGGYFVFSDGFI